MEAGLRRFCLWLADHEIWLVGLFAAAGVLSSRMLILAVGLGGCYWLIRKVARGHFTVRSPLDLALIPMLLMLPLTIMVTALPDQTVPQVFRVLLGVALYYALVNWANTLQRLNGYANGLVFVGFGLALVAPISVKWFTHKLPFMPGNLYEVPLLLSDPIHPNVMAGSLVLILPLMLAFLVYRWHSIRFVHRMAYFVAFAWATFIIILTQSRSAWLAFAMAGLLVAILKWRWAWIGAVFAVVLAVVLVIYPGIDRILDLLIASEALGGLKDRMEIWSRALYIIQDFPLTGVGMGSFMKATDSVYLFFYIGPQKVDHAHNLFLQIAVDLGIPGLISWISAFLLVILSSWKVFRRGTEAQDGLMAGVGAGMLASQLALLMQGMLDAVVWGMVRSAPLIWVLWGLPCASLIVLERWRMMPNSIGNKSS